MPRRPKPEDIDFDIHVDPSCLSAPVDEFDDTFAMAGRESLPTEAKHAVDAFEALETEIREQLDHAMDSKLGSDDHVNIEVNVLWLGPSWHLMRVVI